MATETKKGKESMELGAEEFEAFARRLDYTIKMHVQKEAAAGNFSRTDDLLGIMNEWNDLWKGNGRDPDESSLRALLFAKMKS